MISTYLEVVDEGGIDVGDVGGATLDVVEDTEECRLDTLLTMLETGGDPLGVVLVGTAGDSVVWGGKVCEVVEPRGTVGLLTKELL